MSEKKKLELPYEVFESLAELPSEIQDLMEKAQEARENAYAPYSHFKVGAAVKLSSGTIIVGNNQENAAYPSGLCAERVAIFQAGAIYPNETIVAMAISARSHNRVLNQPVGPCGACRQSMAEYEQKQKSPLAIYFMGQTGKIVKVGSVMHLLPFGFDAASL